MRLDNFTDSRSTGRFKNELSTHTVYIYRTGISIRQPQFTFTSYNICKDLCFVINIIRLCLPGLSRNIIHKTCTKRMHNLSQSFRMERTFIITISTQTISHRILPFQVYDTVCQVRLSTRLISVPHPCQIIVY